MPECEYLLGCKDGFRCHRPNAWASLRDDWGIKAGELKSLMQEVCKADTDEKRMEDCRAFRDLQAIGGQSEYAKPV